MRTPPGDAPVLLQRESDSPDNLAVMVAILRERTEVLGREMRELKDAQREQRDEMRRSQEALGNKLDEVLTVMSEARGGWRVLMIVAGGAAALGGVVTWFMSHIVVFGPRS